MTVEEAVRRYLESLGCSTWPAIVTDLTDPKELELAVRFVLSLLDGVAAKENSQSV